MADGAAEKRSRGPDEDRTDGHCECLRQRGREYRGEKGEARLLGTNNCQRHACEIESVAPIVLMYWLEVVLSEGKG